MKCPKILLTAATIAFMSFNGCAPGTSEELLFSDDRNYQSWVGKTVDHQFTTMDGRTLSLSQYRGKVVLLDFWATWCPPCMRQLPEVKRVYDQLHPEGFEIVGFSFDTDRAALTSVMQRHRISWPQSFDAVGHNRAVGSKFGIQHFPSMWLLDKTGTVRFISAGANLEGKVKELLAEPYGNAPGNPISIAKETFTKAAERGLPDATTVSARTAASSSQGDSDDIRLTGLFAGRNLQQAMLKVGNQSVSLEPGQSRRFTVGGKDWLVACESVTATNVLIKLTRDGEVETLTLTPPK